MTDPIPEAPILRMEGIWKSFGPSIALSEVDLELHPGQVRALVGENGAGKSTLIKIMTGALRPDRGTIWLAGSPVRFDSPQQAQDHGVVAVYQEVNLLSFRTVGENLFLGREPTRRGPLGLIDWRRLNEAAKEILGQLGLSLDPKTTLGTLSIAERQMVAIARAVSLKAKVVVLDEPTSSLSEREVKVLYRIVERLKESGVAIVYISHRFDEIDAICDCVTVLRDGKRVFSKPLKGVSRLDLICAMLGKPKEQLQSGTTALHHHRPQTEAAPLLQARSIAKGNRLKDVALEVDKGEIVGLAGLLGSGRTEVARAIFGLDRIDHGRIVFGGQELTSHSPREAIAAGMGFLAEDRKAEGIFPDLSIRENLTIAMLPLLSFFGVVNRRRQEEVVDRFIGQLRIKSRSSDQKIRELSGGNQQKVLLARWLCGSPALLILDEPTRGIDVGAKGEIQSLIDEMATGGMGVLLISSELEELVEGSSRVVVLRDGRSVAVLPSDQLTEDAIIHAIAERSGSAPS